MVERDGARPNEPNVDGIFGPGKTAGILGQAGGGGRACEVRGEG